MSEETRNGLRRAMLERRRTLPTTACLSWSKSIQARVLELPQYLAARSIALYRAIGKEVETREIIHHALGQEKKVLCPKINSADPVFVQIFSESDLQSDLRGQTRVDVRLAVQEHAGLMVIVPGVVFDSSGNRIGRGGGWYDRALGRFDHKVVIIGLAYEIQIVSSVPVEPWDRKVHYVITESRVIDCGVMPSRHIIR